MNEYSFPAISFKVFSKLILDTSEYMFKRFSASGFFSKDFKSFGMDSESDLAFLIFFTISSALSLRLILE